jgi:translation initiation factor eIF-2B subunit delta
MIDETVEEIADMQTHSSSVVAIKAARALTSLTERDFPTVEEYVRALEQNSDALRRANPSHASLQNTQREITERVEEADVADVTAAQRCTESVVTDVVERVESAKQRAGIRAADRLGDGDVIFTHDYSSTVLSALETAAGDGRNLTVFCSEARPRYLGRKMARTLAGIAGVEPHLVVDSASGHFLGQCDRVFVGMDCIVDETLYNRIGTYPLAVTAADVGVPLDVVGAASKIVDGGFAFENEERSVSEVIREPADGFAVENPAYDATPIRLVDEVVTNEGIRES